jgi:hypothetical protein
MSEEDGFTYYTQAFAETAEQSDDTSTLLRPCTTTA